MPERQPFILTCSVCGVEPNDRIRGPKSAASHGWTELQPYDGELCSHTGLCPECLKEFTAAQQEPA